MLTLSGVQSWWRCPRGHRTWSLGPRDPRAPAAAGEAEMQVSASPVQAHSRALGQDLTSLWDSSFGSPLGRGRGGPLHMGWQGDPSCLS